MCEEVAERRQTISDKRESGFDHVPVEYRANGYYNGSRLLGEECIEVELTILVNGNRKTASCYFETENETCYRGGHSAVDRSTRPKSAEGLAYTDPTNITPETAIFREMLI